MNELLAKVEEIMTPYIGAAAASVGDYRFLVIAMLENFCYGTALLTQDELGFTLPTDVFANIQRETGFYIAQSIRKGFGCVWPSNHYGFTIVGDGVILEETESNNYKYMYVKNEDSRETLMSAMDDGGFVPERMRKQLG